MHPFGCLLEAAYRNLHLPKTSFEPKTDLQERAHLPQHLQKSAAGETPNLYAYYAVLRELIPFIQEECKEDRREMLNELLLSLEKDFEARTRT